MTHIVTLDGALGEGGGQIIRTGLALAAISGRPLAIERIRAKRARPGLAAQHLTAVKAAAALCDAEVAGAQLGSTTLRFLPRRPVAAGDHAFAIGTAGATALVGQTAFLPMALAGGGRLAVTGGTHVSFAPTAGYLARVFAPAAAACGLGLAVTMPRPGFNPGGGGELVLDIAVGRPTPLTRVARGAITGVHVQILTARLPTHVARRGLDAARLVLAELGVPVTEEALDLPAASAGAAVLVVADTEAGPVGFSALGEKGKPMEAVAQAPCHELLAWAARDAAVDEHLADQLVPLLALAEGESRWTTWPVTDHLRTVLEVVKAFYPVETELVEDATGVGHVRIAR